MTKTPRSATASITRPPGFVGRAGQRQKTSPQKSKQAIARARSKTRKAPAAWEMSSESRRRNDAPNKNEIAGVSHSPVPESARRSSGESGGTPAQYPSDGARSSLRR